MIETINVNDFMNRFRDYDRLDNFSMAGLHALFEYLEEYEEETGTQIELDVIALCCEYTEYGCLENFHVDYGYDYQTIEDIAYETTVIEIPDSTSFIIQVF